MKRLYELSREEVRCIQRYLKQVGLYRDKIDGIAGRNTRKALREWRFNLYESVSSRVLTDFELEMLEFRTRWPESREEFVSLYGEFEYMDLPGGAVRIKGDWVERNLIPATFPFFGFLVVHRKIFGSVFAIGEELENLKLDYEVEQSGAWSPRHILHDSSRPLSLHSWGVALDINWASNAYGTAGDLPMELVSVFERSGWTWGGRWGSLEWDAKKNAWVPRNPARLKHSDPMHFQASGVWGR